MENLFYKFYRADAANMLAQCDTAFEAVPLRLVFRAELNREDRHLISSSAAACHNPMYDALLRRYCGDEGERGIGMIFSDDPKGFDDPLFRAIVCHEASHFLENVASGLRKIHEPVGDTIRRIPSRPKRTPSEHHDSTWLRAYIHLTSRAARRGFSVAWGEAVRAEVPAISDVVRTLASECIAKTDSPLLAVLRSPMPERYAALWGQKPASKPATKPSASTRQPLSAAKRAELGLGFYEMSKQSFERSVRLGGISETTAF